MKLIEDVIRLQKGAIVTIPAPEGSEEPPTFKFSLESEQAYMDFVRNWKRLHYTVVAMIQHHKAINQTHVEEGRDRRNRVAAGVNNLPSYDLLFADDKVDEGARRNNQRWKAIYGNVAHEMYDIRAKGKEWIKEHLKDNPSVFRRQEIPA